MKERGWWKIHPDEAISTKGSHFETFAQLRDKFLTHSIFQHTLTLTSAFRHSQTKKVLRLVIKIDENKTLLLNE
jgi:hypothetical protein